MPRVKTGSSPGFTLLEILITAGVLGVFMTMVAQAVMLAYRAENKTTVELQRMRGASLAVDAISRELRLCKQVYNPLPATTFPEGTTYVPTAGTPGPFVFRCYSQASGADEVVGYEIDPGTVDEGGNPNPTVLRLLYDPGYDPANVSSQTLSQPNHIITQGVSALTFYRPAASATAGRPFIQVEVDWLQTGQTQTVHYQNSVLVEGL